MHEGPCGRTRKGPLYPGERSHVLSCCKIVDWKRHMLADVRFDWTYSTTYFNICLRAHIPASQCHVHDRTRTSSRLSLVRRRLPLTARDRPPPNIDLIDPPGPPLHTPRRSKRRELLVKWKRLRLHLAVFSHGHCLPREPLLAGWFSRRRTANDWRGLSTLVPKD